MNRSPIDHERECADVHTFAAVVAHDLRNPLSAVESWSALLADMLDATPSSPDAVTCLERVRRAADRMRRLIDDLLAHATADGAALRCVRVTIADLVAELAAERVDAAAAAGGPVPRFTIGELGEVTADEALLRQLLDNLIGNAIKYTAPGVTPTVTVSASVTVATTLLYVDDNGVGVPVTEREAVFADFHRVPGTADRPGTGLGLAICRRIAERHGGTIRVADNPAGPGSRFTVLLPHRDHPPATAPRTATTTTRRAPAGAVLTTGAHHA